MAGVWWQTLEYLRHGGFIMIPLVVVSVVMWALIVDRLRAFAAWRRGDVDNGEAVALLAGAMLTGQHDEGHGAAVDGPVSSREVLTGQHDAESTPNPTGLRATLVRDFLAERSGDPALDRDILGFCTMRLRRELDEHRATIAVLAAVAPLLGLLGTVLGMIETFDVIAIFGTGNSRAMANGIGIALITTQTGLLVAIPGLLMSNRLGRAAAQLQTGLDETRAALERRLGAKETTR